MNHSNGTTPYKTAVVAPQRKHCLLLWNNSFLNNEPDALITQCFGHLLCPLSGVFHCTFGTGKFYAGVDDRFQAVMEFHPDYYDARYHERKIVEQFSSVYYQSITRTHKE
jgi:hypothetical protein